MLFFRRQGTSASLIAILALAITPLAGGQVLPSTEPGPGHYTVLLAAPSVGERSKLARESPGKWQGPRRVAATSTAALARAVQRSQEPVRESIERTGADIVGTAENVLNAVFVRATPLQASLLQMVDGVRAVVPSRPMRGQIDEVARSDLLRLAAARQGASGHGTDGSGMRIGIIDSGLDFNHPAFRSDSLTMPVGYPRGRPQDLPYASAKVIAVRSYMRMQNSGVPETSTPDDLSPADASGHGTAVAMIAAGRSVGLESGDSVEGIAPGAHLGIYKVIGTPGVHESTSTQAVIAAIDDAVADGMDILNISLGTPAPYPWDSTGRVCGESDPLALCDPLAAAAQSAVVDFGVVVVASAGNRGGVRPDGMPKRSGIGSPAIAPDVLAVGAVGNARRIVESVRVGGLTYRAFSGSGPSVSGTLTGTLAIAANHDNRLGCQDYGDASLAGRIAVVDRGDCWFVDKVELAYRAGATGVIVVNHADEAELVRMATLEETSIPAYMISSTDGARLLQAASTTPSLVVTLEATPVAEPTEWSRVATFSSRGPTAGLLIKPDLAAPGESILTAAARPDWRDPGFRPNGFEQFEGTSVAAPFVAGAAALVWQRNPDFTAREVASALVNQARDVILEDGGRAEAGAVGGGLLDIQRALSAEVTATPSSVSFGILPRGRPPAPQTFLLTNRTARFETYRLAVVEGYASITSMVRIGGAPALSDFDLAPNEFVEVTVTMEGSPQTPGSYEGTLDLFRSRDGARMLRLPFYFVRGTGAASDGYALAGEHQFGVYGEGSRRTLRGKWIDRFGVPVANAAVGFAVRSGDGQILSSSTRTDEFGVAQARVQYTSTSKLQEVVATCGGVEVSFSFEAVLDRPVVDEAMSLARYEVGHPVAPGSLMIVLGGHLGEFTGVPKGSLLPIALQGTSASFDHPELGISVPARLHLVEQGQANLQVPWELAGLNFAHLKIRTRGRHGTSVASAPLTVNLDDVAPGVLSFIDTDGSIVPELFHADGSLVTPEHPAERGELVYALMTGNGPLVEPVPNGRGTADFLQTVHRATVSVGSFPAQVEYSGSTPGLAGVYQVEFIVPQSVPSGMAEVEVTIRGARSNVVQLPVR